MPPPVLVTVIVKDAISEETSNPNEPNSLFDWTLMEPRSLISTDVGPPVFSTHVPELGSQTRPSLSQNATDDSLQRAMQKPVFSTGWQKYSGLQSKVVAHSCMHQEESVAPSKSMQIVPAGQALAPPTALAQEERQTPPGQPLDASAHNGEVPAVHWALDVHAAPGEPGAAEPDTQVPSGAQDRPLPHAALLVQAGRQ